MEDTTEILHEAYIVIAAIISAIGLSFTAHAQNLQTKSKMMSDWIDNFRKEISEFASQINTISIIWNAELEAKNCKEMSKAEFKDFKIKYKDNYIRLYDSYSSINLRFYDDKNANEQNLENLLSEAITSFEGNDTKCGVDGKNKLNNILIASRKIIRSNREEIEKNLNRRIVFYVMGALILIAAAVITLLIIWPKITVNNGLMPV